MCDVVEYAPNEEIDPQFLSNKAFVSGSLPPDACISDVLHELMGRVEANNSVRTWSHTQLSSHTQRELVVIDWHTFCVCVARCRRAQDRGEHNDQRVHHTPRHHICVSAAVAASVHSFIRSFGSWLLD